MGPTPQFEAINLEISDQVACITLNRPGTLNALTAALGRELLAAIEHLSSDPQVRCLILTGSGRGFCSGADLRELAAPGGGAPEVGMLLREVFNPVILGLRNLEKPVIAAVNGAAVGIGLSLAVAADIVVGAQSAYFRLAFANLGLTIDGGASALLTGRIGHARATELALLGRRLSSQDAADWGLINQVVPDDELLEAAGALAGSLTAGPPGSYAAMKRTLNAAAYPHLQEALDLEAELQQELAGSSDFTEGVRAFLERRPAEFSGD